MESARDPRSTVPGLGRQSNARAESGWVPGGASNAGAPAPKRTVCDHCRRRRIRCDGQFPCQQCINTALSCKRDHVPRKRGPKRGHGRVINELRAQEAQAVDRDSRESSFDPTDSGMADMSTDGGDMSAPQTAPNSLPSSPPDTPWTGLASDPRRNSPESRGVYTTDQYRPTSRSYLHLVPQCLELYYEHIYPIMPLLYMPAIRSMISRPMTFSEKNLVYALCALTCLHMRGKSLQVAGPDSWESAGRFFLDECISVRQSYDFFEDQSLYAVISSFWVSTSFFEIHQDRKSWLYLREALDLALELGLDDDSTYVGSSPEEKLCRQRVYWILFVTERSFAILRYKHITFKRTPSLPSTRHWYEAADIHSGFRQLISSYEPLDESFVTAWNEKSDSAVRNDGPDTTDDDAAYRALQATFTALQTLQDRLSRPLAFLTRCAATTPSTQETARAYQNGLIPTSNGVPQSYFPSVAAPIAVKAEPDTGAPAFPLTSVPVIEDTEPEPTLIQKADLLITQQWLRLIVWRKSEQRKLLSWNATHESMNVAFPLDIARRTVAILQSLPSTAVEVHGMGMFEKIFKIGMSYVDTLAAYDLSGRGNLVAGILSPGRQGFAIDPLEFLVKTLSSTPNSRKQFAEELSAYASRRPGGMKLALSPQPNLFPIPWQPPGPHFAMAPAPTLAPGAVLGEVVEDDHPSQQALRQPNLSNNTGVTIATGQPVGFRSEFEVGLISPGVTAGFGDTVPPGLGSGVLWEPPIIHTAQSWAVHPGSGEPSPTGFTFGNQNLAAAGFTYETLHGETMATGGNMAFPRYHATAQGLGITDQEGNGESRKRGWDISGTWQT